VATRARERGSLAGAAQRLERAAQLTGDTEARSGRLPSAAELQLALGHTHDARRLAENVGAAHSPRKRGRLTRLRTRATTEVRGDPDALLLLADTTDEMIAADELNLALKLLMTAARSFSWADRGQGMQARLLDTCERLPVPEDDLRLSVILARRYPRTPDRHRCPRRRGRGTGQFTGRPELLARRRTSSA
jgi:hypothetical protein